ncbi:MAG: polyprenyl synthetase family protein [Candidatus Ancillula sp.]|nr:polyprenyl synthetase family protein [Candidatus Ancillula sp.]
MTKIIEEDVDNQFVKIVNHYRDNPGKKVRAKLLFQTAAKVARVNGGLPNEAEQRLKTAASAIEMMHTASIIHDDVLDENDARRGIESLNKVHGEKIALVAGDVLFARSLSIISKINDGYAVSQCLKCLRVMTEGQMKESVWGQLGYIPESHEMLEVLKMKTGTLFGLALRLGGYFASPASVIPELFSTEFAEELDEYAEQGENFGIAYQLRDDIEDIEEDKANGVLTVPQVLGIEKTKILADKYQELSYL